MENISKFSETEEFDPSQSLFTDDESEYDPSRSLFSSDSENEENGTDDDSQYDPSQSLFSNYEFQHGEDRDDDSQYDPSQSLFSNYEFQHGEGRHDENIDYQIELEFERHIRKFNVRGKHYRVIIPPFENLNYSESVMRLHNVFQRKCYFFSILTTS